MIDLYTSRRKEFIPCTYWKKDKANKDLEKYVLETIPTGNFYCGIVGSLQKQKVILGNFMLSSTVLMIYTNDNVEIEEGASVKYKNKYYKAENVQIEEHNAENEFTNSPSKTTYIQLKG